VTIMSRTTTRLLLKRMIKGKVIYLLALAYVVIPGGTNTATAKLESAIPPAQTLEFNTSVFEYQLENRPDPFVPFITEKAATANVDMDEIIETNEQLTGMQLFEPGQLNLVALMQMGTEDIAMVEDFTGKGYVLTEGTKIGRRGIVKDISPNTVVIEETAETRAGKKIITQVVMILKKEGDE